MRNREACEGIIKSPDPEGWRSFGRQHDDGDFRAASPTGLPAGTLPRRSGQARSTTVVVYKATGSRAACDFASWSSCSNQNQVSFVSVHPIVQHHETAWGSITSRALSFAQFERE